MKIIHLEVAWRKAPSWAKWVSRNEDGIWYWSKYEPYPTDDGYWIISGQKELAFCESKTDGYQLVKFSKPNI